MVLIQISPQHFKYSHCNLSGSIAIPQYHPTQNIKQAQFILDF